MIIEKNITVNGSGERPMLTDVFVVDKKRKKPVVIYAHGFNGFKDWANFDLIAQKFATAGFAFIKFNFSHNGTTIDAPEDFADLDAYAENNYTIELDDLKSIIDWVCDEHNPFAKSIDTGRIFLIGHSMGGGICILKAAEDDRIKALATWASIGECKTPWTNWSKDKIDQWKKDGVAYIMNSRTKQNMPLNYQLYENYQNNAERLDIKKAMKGLSIPVFICHGEKDEAVPVETAFDLQEQNPSATVFIVDSDHVFGRKHPATSDQLPGATQQVVDATINFFKK